MSPFDHPATADTWTKQDGDNYLWDTPDLQRRFWGWIPERAIMEDNADTPSRRDPYGYFTVEQCDDDLKR